MPAPQLRIIFLEDEDITSYYYLDKKEGLRVIAILKVLRETQDWISASAISEMIATNLAATLSTISKMAGAKKIDLHLPEGIKTIAKRPFICVKKDKRDTEDIDAYPDKPKYYKPAIYVKHIRQESRDIPKKKNMHEKDMHKQGYA